MYLDGEKAGTTTETSYDCYTTEVTVHEAYVEAEYTDGTTNKTDTVSFGVSKKGLGLAEDMGRNISLKNMDAVGITTGEPGQVPVSSTEELNMFRWFGNQQMQTI